MKLSISSTFIFLATVGQITACQTTLEPTENNKASNTSQVIFQIAANTVYCTTGGPVAPSVNTKCLVVNGEIFYDAIDGYDHQEGVGRAVKIARTQFCDPDVYNSCPQDIVNIYDYHLLEIIE